jgi:hypothetical protein
MLAPPVGAPVLQGPSISVSCLRPHISGSLLLCMSRAAPVVRRARLDQISQFPHVPSYPKGMPPSSTCSLARRECPPFSGIVGTPRSICGSTRPIPVCPQHVRSRLLAHPTIAHLAVVRARAPRELVPGDVPFPLPHSVPRAANRHTVPSFPSGASFRDILEVSRRPSGYSEPMIGVCSHAPVLAKTARTVGVRRPACGRITPGVPAEWICEQVQRYADSRWETGTCSGLAAPDCAPWRRDAQHYCWHFRTRGARWKPSLA